jgi:hypothetical protein
MRMRMRGVAQFFGQLGFPLSGRKQLLGGEMDKALTAPSNGAAPFALKRMNGAGRQMDWVTDVLTRARLNRTLSAAQQ